MPPILATGIWLVCLVLLFVFDPAKESKPSLALWVPLTWMFILGSRLPTQWLGLQTLSTQAEVLEEGDPLNRGFFIALIVLALIILISRPWRWGDLIFRNLSLTLFVLFALLSVFWSDFAFVAFKRWFRDLGNYLMVLVVLTDAEPAKAVRLFFRRLAYLLIPLSVLLDKYYPNLSRQFDQWSGMGMFVGATTGKNLLGLDALIGGLFFFWDILNRWSSRQDRRTKRIIWLDVIFLLMSLTLLNTANSATCKVCMGLGCFVIALTHTKAFSRHPSFFRMAIPGIFALYLLMSVGLGMSGDLASAVGKDPTLTDRTLIWNTVLNMRTNPIVGVGYESFWLGPRLEQVWRVVPGINEAHDGYLEVYLNLGLIGLCLIISLLITTYRNIFRNVASSQGLASFNLALWTVMLFYSVTEVGFRSGPMWVALLLGGIVVERRAVQAFEPVTLGAFRAPKTMPRLPLEMIGKRR